MTVQLERRYLTVIPKAVTQDALGGGPPVRTVSGQDFPATSYATLASLVQHASFDDVKDALQRRFPMPKSILDIGCGDGSLTCQAKDVLGPGAAAVGVDISPFMIELACARYRGAGEGLAFLVRDAAALTPDAVSGRTFDAVISNFALHWLYHLGRLPAMFAALNSITSSNAVLVCSVPVAGNLPKSCLRRLKVRRPLSLGELRFGNASLLLRVSPEAPDLVRLIEENGFRVTDAIVIERFHLLKSIVFAAWLQVSIRFPQLACLAADDQRKFCTEVIERYTADPDYPPA